MRKTALITGITGQDGAYLAEFLLKKDYIVHGIKRRSSLFNTDRIDHLYQDPHAENKHFILHYGDLTDSMNITRLIQQIQPDEVYNLAAMSHVQVSFETPEYTANADGLGTLRLLEAIRLLGLEKRTRIYQASTSELFGKVQALPQKETTPFYPRSPYAAAKLYAYWITVNYREAYDLFASNGILFNHESPIRGETFVTRKITRAAARIALGLQEKLYLGNLNSKRDWGHAKDYVEMMWMILQYDKADDWVCATGITTEVREFVRLAFAELGISVAFKGKGVEEKGIVSEIDKRRFAELGLRSAGDGGVPSEPPAGLPGMSEASPGGKLGTPDPSSIINAQHTIKRGDVIVEVDPRYFRPAEVDILVGDSSKARDLLGWKPKYNLLGLVREMVASDLKLMKRENYLKAGGYEVMNYYE